MSESQGGSNSEVGKTEAHRAATPTMKSGGRKICHDKNCFMSL